MAEKHELEIIIMPDGQVKMEVKGMKGSGCVPVLRKVAEKLGSIKSQELLPEYYGQTSTRTQQQKQS